MFSGITTALCRFVKNTGQVLNESGITHISLIALPKMERIQAKGRANRHANTTMSD
jgi:hypothetical protein